MKPMGNPPPRSPETGRIKAEIYRIAYKDSHKSSIPLSVMHDQFGIIPEHEALSPLDCVKCGEKFAVGKGFIFDNKTGDCLCSTCFREMAIALLDGTK